MRLLFDRTELTEGQFLAIGLVSVAAFRAMASCSSCGFGAMARGPHDDPVAPRELKGFTARPMQRAIPSFHADKRPNVKPWRVMMPARIASSPFPNTSSHLKKDFKETPCWMPTNCFGHKFPPAFAR
jgi:hypothetical protein